MTRELIRWPTGEIGAIVYPQEKHLMRIVSKLFFFVCDFPNVIASLFMFARSTRLNVMILMQHDQWFDESKNVMFWSYPNLWTGTNVTDRSAGTRGVNGKCEPCIPRAGEFQDKAGKNFCERVKPGFASRNASERKSGWLKALARVYRYRDKQSYFDSIAHLRWLGD